MYPPFPLHSVSGKSTPTLSHPPKTNSSPFPASVLSSLSYSLCPPFSFCLSNPSLGSEWVPAFRPLSQATQEIMDICNVDQTGCEDPDLDTDATTHALHSLEKELRLLAKGTDMSTNHACRYTTMIKICNTCN